MIVNDKYNIRSEDEQKCNFFCSSFINYISRLHIDLNSSTSSIFQTYSFCKPIEYLKTLSFIWDYMKNSDKRFIVVSTPCCYVELSDGSRAELICKTSRIRNDFILNNDMWDRHFEEENYTYYMYHLTIAPDFYGIRMAQQLNL